jgi:cell wall-associated NlpC family hydrolase
VLATAPAANAASHLGDRVLREGMSGHDVRVLQDYLGRDGYRTTIDGYFGSKTKALVVRFERAQHLKADGVVGTTVANALRRVANARAGGGASIPAPEADPPITAPPTGKAKLLSDGTAVAPEGAPSAIVDLIAAGNKIAKKPYVYGGGHASWSSRGYDCSGSVSYALHGAGLLSSPLDSTSFESYGSRGKGRWITIYANSGHAYMVVAGLRFDTSGANPSRWQTAMRSGSGYVVRHPTGW